MSEATILVLAVWLGGGMVLAALSRFAGPLFPTRARNQRGEP